MSKPIEDMTVLRDLLNAIIKDNQSKESEESEELSRTNSLPSYIKEFIDYVGVRHSTQTTQKAKQNSSPFGEISLNLEYEVRGKDSSFIIRDGNVRDIDGIISFLREYGYLEEVNDD